MYRYIYVCICMYMYIFQRSATPRRSRWDATERIAAATGRSRTGAGARACVGACVCVRACVQACWWAACVCVCLRTCMHVYVLCSCVCGCVVRACVYRYVFCACVSQTLSATCANLTVQPPTLCRCNLRRCAAATVGKALRRGGAPAGAQRRS